MSQAICSICKQETVVTTRVLPSFVETNQQYTYQYFSCCNCYRQATFPTAIELEALYEKEYHVFHTKGIFTWLRNRTIQNRAKKFSHLIKEKDVLEIGCGTGDFLHYCKSHNPSSLQGVEISEYASAVAKERYGVPVVCSTFENFTSEKQYDVIFMFHVIEHVTDPVAVVNKCKSLLKENGVLVMETPNCDSYECEFYGDYWIGWSVPFHTFLFSPKSLTEISVRCNFKGNKIHHHPISNTYSFLLPYLMKHKNPLLLPFYAFNFLIQTLVAPFRQKSGTITIEMNKN